MTSRSFILRMARYSRPTVHSVVATSLLVGVFVACSSSDSTVVPDDGGGEAQDGSAALDAGSSTDARVGDSAANADGSQPKTDAGTADGSASDSGTLQASQVVALAIGNGRSNHNCALLNNKALKCWGPNGDGQLGIGPLGSKGNSPGQMGANLPVVDVGAGRYAVSVTLGEGHTCALLDDGSVKCWGLNDRGQLGLGDTTFRAVPFTSALDLGAGRTALAIAGGRHHTCAILDTHAVVCWGYNGEGELGRGDTVNWGTKPGQMGAQLTPIDFGAGRYATAISGGSLHTCAILDDQSLKCWGHNAFGQLGSGNNLAHGDKPNTMGANLPVVDLGPGHTVLAVSSGEYHNCAILEDHSLKCWGYDYYGALGLGESDQSHPNRGTAPGQMGANLPNVDVGTGRTVLNVAAGQQHTCATLDNHTAKCWGYGFDGQLGNGVLADVGMYPGEMGDKLVAVDFGPGRSALSVVAKNDFSCALLDDHTVKCWGLNGVGQLGLGDIRNRGGFPTDMGAKLPVVQLW